MRDSRNSRQLYSYTDMGKKTESRLRELIPCPCATSLPPQVSHHPPVAVCHAASISGRNGGPSWTWSQDLRVKTKFWGKSMEFQPEGVVRVELRRGSAEGAWEFVLMLCKSKSKK